MLYKCKLLKSIPDISKWKINKRIFMSQMLYNCQSLKNGDYSLKYQTKDLISKNYTYCNYNTFTSLNSGSKYSWYNKENLNIYSMILDFQT